MEVNRYWYIFMYDILASDHEWYKSYHFCKLWSSENIWFWLIRSMSDRSSRSPDKWTGSHDKSTKGSDMPTERPDKSTKSYEKSTERSIRSPNRLKEGTNRHHLTNRHTYLTSDCRIFCHHSCVLFRSSICIRTPRRSGNAVVYSVRLACGRLGIRIPDRPA